MLAIVSLVACAESGSVKTDYCFIARPIYLSDNDILTPKTENDIIQHNEIWEDTCDK